MRSLSIYTVLLSVLMLSGCAFLEKDTEVRSPCVSADTGMNTHGQHPCDRRPANAHWVG